MKKLKFDQPLTEAAADSLKVAAKAALARARQTGVPVVVWRDGKVVKLPLFDGKTTKPRTLVKAR